MLTNSPFSPLLFFLSHFPLYFTYSLSPSGKHVQTTCLPSALHPFIFPHYVFSLSPLGASFCYCSLSLRPFLSCFSHFLPLPSSPFEGNLRSSILFFSFLFPSSSFSLSPSLPLQATSQDKPFALIYPFLLLTHSSLSLRFPVPVPLPFPSLRFLPHSLWEQVHERCLLVMSGRLINQDDITRGLND